jgi:trigger factor
MNVEIEDSGVCRKKVKVEWPVERVAESYKRILGEFGRVANIKGFRQGKAPIAVVEKKYAKQILEEVRDRLLPEGYQSAIKDKALDVVQVLNIDEQPVTLGEPFTFTVTIEVAPEFDLPTYTGIKLERKRKAIKDEAVEERITAILEQFASFDEVEGRAIQRGDMAQVNYEGVCEGQPIESLGGEVKGLDKRNDFWVRVDENAFIPEFEAGLIGAAVGDKKDIQVDFSETFPVKALAGKKATYHVEVKSVREKKVPQLNEEMLKMMRVDSADDLRVRIRKDLESQAEQESNAGIRDALVDHLLGQVTMDIPETPLQRETSQILRDVIRSNTERGITAEQMSEHRDQMMESATRTAEKRVKLQFILDRIAAKESISVSGAQLRQHVDRLAPMYGMKPDALMNELKKRDALDEVEGELRRAMVVDLLLEKAEIKEVAAD